MKKILVALSALAISTAAASAADLAPKYTKAPPAPPPPPCIWCGFYVGLNGGWAGTTGGNGNQNSTVTSVEEGTVPVFVAFGNFNNNNNNNGGFGGGQIGYNWAWPGAGAAGYGSGYGWLVGVETDIQGVFNNNNNNNNTLFFFSDPAIVGGVSDPNAVSADRRLSWFGTLRGRVGITSGPVLFYGTGGLAYGGIRNNLIANFVDNTDCIVGVTATTCAASSGFFNNNNNNNNTRWGWVAGVGIEWMFAPNWSLKGEYQYIDLGSVTQTAAALVNTENLLGTSEVEGVIATRSANMRFNTVRIGVNYHFGGYGGPVGY